MTVVFVMISQKIVVVRLLLTSSKSRMPMNISARRNNFPTMTTTSQIKKECQRYLGNRGINEEIKRCAYHDGLWFIVFASAPEDVEVSKESSCYECYDIIPAKDFAWSLSSYKAIKHGL